MEKKVASFFGGGSGGSVDSTEYSDSLQIGAILTGLGYEVRNGGYYGLMEAVSKGASSSGGRAVGYTCANFGRVVGNKYLSETVVARDIYDRLRLLIDESSVIVAVRGSVGTLAEVLLAIDVNRKKPAPAKIILFGDFWIPIIGMLSAIVSNQDLLMLRHIRLLENLKEELVQVST